MLRVAAAAGRATPQPNIPEMLSAPNARAGTAPTSTSAPWRGV